MNNSDKKAAASTKKQKVTQSDKYYKMSADFSYLKNYNYKITKQIGRGGYGVVYKVNNYSIQAQDLTNSDALCAIKINFNTVSRQLIYSQMAYLQIVKGLRNLKQLGIYHRDIKPGNFLYNPDTRKGVIIDFGLAQLDPKYIQKLEQKISKIRQTNSNDPQLQHLQQNLRTYKKLQDCLKTIGNNKIGTQTYMPIQSILHHKAQSYNSDIWPVGVILMQFIARKYNIFNNVRIVNKPSGVRNTYFINYIIQLATFFGSKINQQCRLLGYQLKLPKQIQQIKFSQISCIDGYNDVVDDLLHRLLDLNAQTRITVQQAIQHKFFDSVRQQHLPKDSQNRD